MVKTIKNHGFPVSFPLNPWFLMVFPMVLRENLQETHGF